MQVTVTVITASLFPVSGSLSTMTGGFSLGIMLDNSNAGGKGEGVSYNRRNIEHTKL